MSDEITPGDELPTVAELIVDVRAKARAAAIEEAAQIAESGHRDEWSPRFIAERIRDRISKKPVGGG